MIRQMPRGRQVVPAEEGVVPRDKMRLRTVTLPIVSDWNTCSNPAGMAISDDIAIAPTVTPARTSPSVSLYPALLVLFCHP